ncbi:MAG: HEAT repeat domain-containing protein [bacterium]
MRELITILLTHEDIDTRRNAAEELAESKEMPAITALTTVLEDNSTGVRDAAARSLLSIGGPTVARAIANYIANENITTRNLAAKLLMQLGAASIPALLPFVQDPNKDTRKFAVDILGEIRNSGCVYYLLPLLQDDDSNVICSTLEALGNIKSVQAIPAICEAFEAHPFARTAAAEALGKIANPNAKEFLLTKLKGGLEERLYEPIELFAILEAIGNVGDQKVVNYLLEHARDVEGKLRNMLLHAAVQIIEQQETAFHFPAALRSGFLSALQDDDENIRISAVKGLSQFEEQDVTRALLSVLGISEELDFLLFSELLGRDDVFRMAVDALEEARIRCKKELILLIGKLAFEAIRRYKYFKSYQIDGSLVQRAFELIMNEWRLADQEVRSIILDTLFRLNGDQAVERMNQIVSDPDPWIRVHVIELLSDVKDQRAAIFIAQFLNDDDEMVREAAISNLQARGIAIDIPQWGEPEY